MPKSYKKLQQNLKFDSLMNSLSQNFNRIPDHRRANASYRLADVLKSAFAMFSLKCPSLLSFKEQTKHEKSNLRSIYQISKIASDTQMREILDKVAPAPLRDLFRRLFTLLTHCGVVKDYEYWHHHVIVSVDGVEHFCSTNIHCQHCTTKTHRNGELSYHHAGLAAVMVHPEYKEVFPLDFEPVLRADGAQKNDCERTAAKRLCDDLQRRYPQLKMLLVEDALYANAPHIRQLQSYGWSYVLNVKADSHKSLFAHFEGRRRSGQVKEQSFAAGGVKHRFYYSNDLFLCDSATDVRVNVLLYEEEDADGQVKRFSWITPINLTARSVGLVMRAGRARWKIENETFNTLKNQGYHFEHNYGHGYNHLATVLALLMMLAFMVDQIQERCCTTFRQLRAGLRTRAKLWDTLRGLFKVLSFRSMEALLQRMALLYDLKIE